jgi:hypothetical protein
LFIHTKSVGNAYLSWANSMSNFLVTYATFNRNSARAKLPESEESVWPFVLSIHVGGRHSYLTLRQLLGHLEKATSHLLSSVEERPSWCEGWKVCRAENWLELRWMKYVDIYTINITPHWLTPSGICGPSLPAPPAGTIRVSRKGRQD